jgi:acylphosphatase
LRVAVRIRVTGIVHGVFFRASMAEVVRQEDVNGWVKNVSDGSVEAVLEGEQDSVQRVVEWAKRGPPRARVDSVEIEDFPVRNLKGFRIAG